MQTGLLLKVAIGQFDTKVCEILLSGEFNWTTGGTNTNDLTVGSPSDMPTQPPLGR